MGAGPWKFVSWNANEKVVVTRADKYWRTDRGFVDGIDDLPLMAGLAVAGEARFDATLVAADGALIIGLAAGVVCYLSAVWLKRLLACTFVML